MTKALAIQAVTPTLLALSFSPEVTNMLPLLVTAAFVGLANMLALYYAHQLAMKKMREDIKPVVEKIDAIVPLVTKIDGHVNSEKSRMEGEITTLNMQVDMQRQTIADLKLSKELLAQAKAIADASAGVRPVAAPRASDTPVTSGLVAPSGEPILESMAKDTKETAKNTAETAENTKKTDAAVTELKKKL